jgi:hypothetical protein
MTPSTDVLHSFRVHRTSKSEKQKIYYFCHLFNGIPNGFGIQAGYVESVCTDLFVGNWINGQQEKGKGHQTRKFSTYQINDYQGEFLNGLKSGHGDMKYANGQFYSGEWMCNKRSGFGSCSYKNGDENYVGMWSNDQREGQGVMHSANGDIYTGEWIKNKKHGQGEMRYIDGTVYKGKNKVFK